MASCGSSLALSRGRHSVSPFHAARAGRLYLKPQAVSLHNNFGLQSLRTTTTTVVASVTNSGNSNGVLAGADAASVAVNSSTDERGAAPVVRKRGRPKKVKIVDSGSSTTSPADAQETTTEAEEEEWDFFGELATHIESEHGATSKPDHPVRTPNAIEVEAAPQTATGNANGSSSKSSEVRDAAASASSFRDRQQISREERTDVHNDDDDDVDLDDPKYQQKPDWMQDAAWESIVNSNQDDDDDEGQPLWVDEDDPTWPADEPEDGWGFRTSQFFDKISVKNEKADDDVDVDEEELQINWENEADDWMIPEITSSDWEVCVFANPTPLVVYIFARYGRRGLDSWKTLDQLEKAVTKIWESNKAPLRAVKVDIGMEIDLGSALGISKDACPQLLFIKNGKGLYRLEEQRTSEELVQLMAHFFYNGAKPACLKTTTSSPENFRSVG